MAAVELLETYEVEAVPSHLRLMSGDASPRVFREGPSLAQRRRVRARVRQRRQRLAAAWWCCGALTILALPGHVYGATTGAGTLDRSGELVGAGVGHELRRSAG